VTGIKDWKKVLFKKAAGDKNQCCWSTAQNYKVTYRSEKKNRYKKLSHELKIVKKKKNELGDPFNAQRICHINSSLASVYDTLHILEWLYIICIKIIRITQLHLCLLYWPTN
jgi:hypothetical protein